MALGGNVGIRVEALPSGPVHAVLFGEDQGRYVVSVAADRADGLIREAEAAGVAAMRIGAAGGGDFVLPGEPPIPLEALREPFETAFPIFMTGEFPPGFV